MINVKFHKLLPSATAASPAILDGNNSEENLMLKDRLTKLSKQHVALQENYQKLLNVMTFEQKIGSSEQRMNIEGNAADFVEALIAEETEKCLKEESKHCEELQSKIQDEIEALKRTLKDETI